MPDHEAALDCLTAVERLHQLRSKMASGEVEVRRQVNGQWIDERPAFDLDLGDAILALTLAAASLQKRTDG